MSNKRIKDQIDELFLKESSSENLRYFIERLHKNQDASDRSISRRFFVLVLTWAVFYGVGSGYIEDGRIATFLLRNSTNCLLSVPHYLAFSII